MAQAEHPGRAVELGHASTIQKVTALLSAVFVLIGIAGFIPGITTDYDELSWATTESQAELFGIFQVSVLHNVVHILIGLVGLAAARSAGASRMFLIGAGFVYLLLMLYGLIIDDDGGNNFVPLNTADDWLHLVLGAGMIALGVALAGGGSDERGAGKGVEGGTGRAGGAGGGGRSGRAGGEGRRRRGGKRGSGGATRRT